MKNISFRSLLESELSKIAEVDRSEHSRKGYEIHEGEILSMDVDWDVPRFMPEGEGEHTVSSKSRSAESAPGMGLEQWEHLMMRKWLRSPFSSQRCVKASQGLRNYK